MDASKLGRQFYNWNEPIQLVGKEGVTEAYTTLSSPIHPVSGGPSYAYGSPKPTEDGVGLPNAYVDRWKNNGQQRFSLATSYIPTNLSEMKADEVGPMFSAADAMDQGDKYGYEGSFRTLTRARVAADAMASRRIGSRNPKTGR
jgi:hypothetical protein